MYCSQVLNQPGGKFSTTHTPSSTGPFRLIGHESGNTLSVFKNKTGIHTLFEGHLLDVSNLDIDSYPPVTIDDPARLISLGYQQFGTDVFDKLGGRYWAAIWDEGARTLLISHDHFSRCPVYYAECREGLIFSSNIFALAYSGKIERTPNRLSMALRLLGKWPEAGETFFSNIRRLRPGHYLSWTARSRLKEICYNELFPLEPREDIRIEDAFSRFESTFEDAVDRDTGQKPRGDHV